MIQCRLFKALWVGGRNLYMQCDLELPAVPSPGALIYVGTPDGNEYDEDVIELNDGSVFLRANEPRVYAWVQPFNCDSVADETLSPQQWVKHFESFGWQECPAPKPWSVKFGVARHSLVH
jgi:hypothetical protein